MTYALFTHGAMGAFLFLPCPSLLTAAGRYIPTFPEKWPPESRDS